MDAVLFDQYLNRMQAYCSRSEKCIFDVKKKLDSLDVNSDIQEKIVSVLKNEGFIDELRYARAFTSDKFRFNRWGRIKIRIELQQRNIADETIREALNEISQEDYIAAIGSLIDGKKIHAKSNYEYRQKVLRFLYGKGFEPEIVTKVLDNRV
jgi:regulatory protein